MIKIYLDLVSKKKSQIVLFILFNLCGLFFILSPYGIFWNMIDLYFSYSPADVFKSFYQMGENGRYFYLYTILILDTIYPILYTSLVLGAYTNLFKNQSYILLIPILAFTLDILENINITYMNLNYLILNETQVMVASNITSLKWIIISIMIFLLAYGLFKKKTNA